MASKPTLTIVIDEDVKCRACGKPGATQCGLCLPCAGKRIGEKYGNSLSGWLIRPLPVVVTMKGRSYDNGKGMGMSGGEIAKCTVCGETCTVYGGNGDTLAVGGLILHVNCALNEWASQKDTIYQLKAQNTALLETTRALRDLQKCCVPDRDELVNDRYYERLLRLTMALDVLAAMGLS